MRWLLAAAVSGIVFAAIVSSTFVPLRDSADIDYLFAWPGTLRLTVAAGIAAGTIVALFALVVALARRRSQSARELALDGRWLAPLAGPGLVIIGILPAVPGIGQHAAPLAYFFYDLRWWWIAVLTGWTLLNAHPLVGSPLERLVIAWTRWSPAARLLTMDAVVFVGVMAWATVTTPNLRFSGVLHGDEPKYIRYCEVWYQGGGLDISSKELFADQPLDSSPHLVTSLGRLPRAIVEETGVLLTDLSQYVVHPLTFRWNRATGGNGFVKGKHGGIYEIYQPGLSAVLFPGYFVDRYLLGLHPGYQGEFPDELVMTNVMMLLVFGFCGVALFRLLRILLVSDALALLWSAVGVIMLPAGAFAFQFYPELVALLILLVVSNFLLARVPSARPVHAFAAGAACGSLGWLHPRFLLLSLALAAIGFIRARSGVRRAFVASYCLVLLSVMGFDYRVTGSWLPTARWDTANTEGTLNPSFVPMNLVGYLFHRTWGLFPHAPLLIAATPGLLVLWRRAPRLVIALLAFALCLFVPAAAHTLAAASGTPGRLVLAVVPLFIWPVAVVARRFWSSGIVRSALIVLLMLSMDAALSYNWTHQKPFGPIRGASMSGWKPNLMFPNVDVDLSTWAASSVIVLAMFVLMIAALSIAAWRRSGSPERSSDETRSTSRWMAVLPIAVAPTIFVALTAMMGGWYRDEYLLNDGDARRAVARALVSVDRCRVCFTSREGPIDWTSLNPNRADAMSVELTVIRRRVGLVVTLEGHDDQAPRFARIRVDFGDGRPVSWSGIVDEGRYEHEYRQPGTYSIVTWLQLRDGRTRLDRRTVTVRDGQLGG